jgi:hypothetical protein
MKKRTPPAGGGSPRGPIKAVRDGRPVMLVPLPHDLVATFDLDVWEELMRLGISPRFNVRTNGIKHKRPRWYLKVTALLPWPIGGDSPTHQAARLVVALGFVDRGFLVAVWVRSKRWRVEHINGDHLDLRRENLRVLPAGDKRAGFYAVWDLRERRKLIAKGKDPNAVFAKRRRKRAKP